MSERSGSEEVSADPPESDVPRRGFLRDAVFLGIALIAIGAIATLALSGGDDADTSLQAQDQTDSVIRLPGEVDGNPQVVDPAEPAAATAEPDGAGSLPVAYGDDEGLDLLHDSCTDGDAQACDLLFLEAPGGSEYKQFAQTCAGRSPSGLDWCSSGTSPAADGTVIWEPEGLQALVDDCQGGDFITCDFLFLAAPFGSEVIGFAETCGNRLDTAALPNCRTSLG